MRLGALALVVRSILFNWVACELIRKGVITTDEAVESFLDRWVESGLTNMIALC
jgi:hypothetical protein